MKERIEFKLNELQTLYDSYLEKLNDKNYKMNRHIIEQRIHDIIIEMNTYKNVLEILNEIVEI